MHQSIFFFLASAVVILAPQLEAVCHRCEEVRAHNREHPSSGYVYYEDYVAAQEETKSKSTSTKEEAPNEKAAKK